MLGEKPYTDYYPLEKMQWKTIDGANTWEESPALLSG